MAQMVNTLVNSNDVVGPIDVIDHIGSADVNGAASLMVEAGAGTFVLEASPGQNAAGVDLWVILEMWSPQVGVNAFIASIVGGALQYGYAELVAVRKVRGRCSVAGAGARVTLTMKAG